MAGCPLCSGGSYILEALHTQKFALVSEPGKNWVFMKNLIYRPHMAIEGVLTRQKCAEKWCATLWARVANFLSHRIVKSLTFRIYGKLKFQCTRNGTQNPPFCPGSIQDTFIIFPPYLTTRFPLTKSRKYTSRKSEI